MSKTPLSKATSLAVTASLQVHSSSRSLFQAGHMVMQPETARNCGLSVGLGPVGLGRLRLTP
jgi:hypothetical protein